VVAEGRAGVRPRLRVKRESGIYGMEEGAATGVVGSVIERPGVALREGSLESTGEPGDGDGERRLISACAAGSGATGGRRSAFETSAGVKDWRVGLE
jgi:hypothetical protein